MSLVVSRCTDGIAEASRGDTVDLDGSQVEQSLAQPVLLVSATQSCCRAVQGKVTCWGPEWCLKWLMTHARHPSRSQVAGTDPGLCLQQRGKG